MNVRLEEIDGSLLLGSERISSFMGLDAFRSLGIAKAASTIGNAPKRLQLTCPSHHDRDFGFIFYFDESDHLAEVAFSLSKRGETWSDFSREQQDRNKRWNDEFLLDQLGEPPYRFAWGEVVSVIDPHHYDAMVLIRFGR